MATTFTEDGYTDQDADAIHQALIEAHLKPDADWPRILSEITMLISDVSEGHTHPDTVLFPGTIQRRLKAFRTSLEAVREAYEGLGERVQRHFNDQFSPRDDGKFLSIVNDVLVAVGHAQERPVHPMISYTQEQGAPKNHAMRLIVAGLLEIFERATGTEPKVYTSQHAKDGYAGNFYLFAVACLTPAILVPRKHLGSAILAVYKEWNRPPSWSGVAPSP